ncbi:hypothetical protein SPBR_00832 [Sporothrix brasiliensis 5110]|uniref:Uncharacterized protein n=1 Tax=Sporothrix brasiliensis 5110 TaxID=1398154 RepID=A0A0C2J020_9PEZI|nr:uncharacterized protein SPBR_00832 [Sporothrix brasiliensis 5110]KIH90547.1 hypothetical protein SPBR_00832 [Sporothrix brasiliensis 5110]
MDPNTPARFRKVDFHVPRLRKCPFDLDTVDWRGATLLGAGMDGCVWRVRFGDHGPYYALKLFWDADPAVLYQCYFAAQRECQNAALLQAIRASVDQEAAAQEVLDAGGTLPDDDGPGAAPTLVFPDPQDEYEAASNLYSFSVEIRRDRHKFAHLDAPETMRLRDVPMPRFVQCYGWLRVNAEDLIARMPRHCQPDPVHVKRKEFRYFQKGPTEFIAIVYEYIHKEGGDGTEGDKDTIKTTTVGREQRAVRPSTVRQRPPVKEEPKKELPYDDERDRVASVEKFLHLAGFQFCPQPLRRNWVNGVLVDHSDIIGPRFFGWHKRYYRLRSTAVLLSE